MSLAHGNNTPTRPRIEPGSPDPESDALTTRPVRFPSTVVLIAPVPGHCLFFTFEDKFYFSIESLALAQESSMVQTQSTKI